jgi:hypothetical protein
MAIPLGGKPPSGWSSETYHEDRRAFEHRATQQFARAANKSALPWVLLKYFTTVFDVVHFKNKE